jgi:hypothetical protein
MMIKRINTLLWIGIFGTLVVSTGLFTDIHRAFSGDQGIWWTHQSMKLPIEETKGNFELFIGGDPLWKHLAQGTLISVDKDGKQYSVVAQDVTVRLNNWEKVRASILERTTVSGFAFGVAITLLVIGLIQFFQQKKKPI